MPDYFVKDGDDYKPLPEGHVVLKQDELDSNYYSKSEFGSAVQRKVDERFKNHLHIDKAHEDETVVARVLESHKPEGGADEDAIRDRIMKAHVEPTKRALEEAQKERDSYKGRLKHRALEELFTSEDVGFSDAFVKRVEPSKPSMAEMLVGEDFDLDENGNLVAADSSISAVELAKELVANEAYAPFRAADVKNRSGAGRPGQEGKGSGSGALRKSDMDWQAKAAYIQKHGLSAPKFEGAKPYNSLAD